MERGFLSHPTGRNKDAQGKGIAMAGYLTTHVLDTARGCPAADLEIELFRLVHGGREELARMRTNADGRTDGPILPEAAFATGQYELEFHAGAYLATHGMAAADGPAFLDVIPIRFGLNEAAHFHVPLLLSPYGYSTYRGS